MHNMQRVPTTYIFTFFLSFNSPSQSIIFHVCVTLKIRNISNIIPMFEDKVPSLLTSQYGKTF